MSERRFRRLALAGALGVGVLLAVALGSRAEVPTWCVPLAAGAALLVGELVSLSRGPASGATIERQAVRAVLVGRLLTAVLLAVLGATVALLVAAVPARHGFAIGLVGAAAATGLVLLVAALARPEGVPDAPGRSAGQARGETPA